MYNIIILIIIFYYLCKKFKIESFKNNSLLSIIYPIIDNSDLSNNIQNLLYQNYTNIEIILIPYINDIDTINILKQYKYYKRIKIIYSTYKFTTHQINLGINIATGSTIFLYENRKHIYENTIQKLINKKSSEIINKQDIINKFPINFYNSTYIYNPVIIDNLNSFNSYLSNVIIKRNIKQININQIKKNNICILLSSPYIFLKNRNHKKIQNKRILIYWSENLINDEIIEYLILNINKSTNVYNIINNIELYNKLIDLNIINIKLCLNSLEFDSYIYCDDYDYKYKINNYFDHIYVANLEKRTDRKQIIEERLLKHNIQVNFIKSVNGYEKPYINDYLKYKNKKINKYSHPLEKRIRRKSITSPGAWGYLLTIKKCLEDAKQNKYKKILFLEDDLIFHKNFNKLFINNIKYIHNKWKIILLGGSQHSKNGFIYANKTHINPKTTSGSYAMAINSSIFDELLYKINKMNVVFDDGILRDMYDTYTADCFILTPNLVMPDVSDSNIRDSRNLISFADKMNWNIIDYDMINHNILVSVIIICDNNNDTIEYSSKSIINQYYKNIEIIIIDNNSNDNSVNIILSIIKEYPNIKFIQNEVSDLLLSRNIGIKKSTGNYIFFQYANEISSKSRIETEMICFQYLNYQIITTNSYNINYKKINNFDKNYLDDLFLEKQIKNYDRFKLDINNININVNASISSINKKLLYEINPNLNYDNKELLDKLIISSKNINKLIFNIEKSILYNLTELFIINKKGKLRYIKDNSNIFHFEGSELNYNKLNGKTTFIIIITLYNPGYSLLKRCFESVQNQKYSNYKVCVVDDCSTLEKKHLHSLIQLYNAKYDWKYIISDKNYGPMHSRLSGIKYMNPNPEDIIALVDGDDNLYNDIVLNKLDILYSNEPILLTFGNFIHGDIKGNILPNQQLNKCKNQKIYNHYIKYNLFRQHWGYSHLKTFKYKLLKYIKDDDLKKDGEYIRSATDVALMIPLMEIVGHRFACIDEPTYIYTVNHPLSLMNNTKTLNKQTNNRIYIEKLPKYKYIEKI